MPSTRAVRALALCLPLLAACATGEPPATELAAARAALDDAAPLAMQYAVPEWTAAQAKLGRAEQAFASRDWRAARELAEEAEVDAKYAAALAQAERAGELRLRSGPFRERVLHGDGRRLVERAARGGELRLRRLARGARGEEREA